MVRTADYTPQWFTVRVLVTNAPVDVEFGLDGTGNLRDNTYSFGSNKALFYGDYDKYVQDSAMAVVGDMRDSLQAVIDSANAIRYRVPEGVSDKTFKDAVAAAQAVHDNQSATLDEIKAQMPALETAMRNLLISGVWPEAGHYFDLSFMIQNADFTDETSDFYGWTMEGDQLGVGDGGMVSLYYGKETTFNSKLTQEVKGLPAGKYQFKMNATYREGLTTDFVPADYEENTSVFIVANDKTVPVYGLLADGGHASEDGQTWIFDDENQMTLDEYRRTAPVGQFFDAGYFRSGVEFDLAAAGTATVGLSVVDITSGSFVFARGPQLFFWGDEVVDGIGGVTGGNAGANAISGDVYTLSGVKVRSNATSLDGLAKGVYIVGGKKYVVR